MILRNQVWSSEGVGNGNKIESLMTLSSAGQEAQYDAFLLLLRAFDTPPNGIQPGVLEWNWPAGRLRPPGAAVKDSEMSPLWLTTIGTTGQFPLAVLTPHRSLKDSDFDLQTLDVGEPWYTAMLLWMFFAMLGLLHVWALNFPNALPRLFSDDFDLGDATDTITASKAVCHVAILLIVALIQLVMGSSYVFFRHLNWPYARLGWGVIGVTIILAAAACVVFLIRVAWPWWRARGGSSGDRLPGFGPGFVYHRRRAAGGRRADGHQVRNLGRIERRFRGWALATIRTATVIPASSS